MYSDDCLGSFRDFLLDVCRRYVERIRVRVGEYWRRSNVQNGIGCCHKRVGGYYHFVSVFDIEGEETCMQSCSAGIHRHGFFRSDALGELSLKRLDVLSRSEPPRGEYVPHAVEDFVEVFSFEEWFRERYSGHHRSFLPSCPAYFFMCFGIPVFGLRAENSRASFATPTFAFRPVPSSADISTTILEFGNRELTINASCLRVVRVPVPMFMVILLLLFPVTDFEKASATSSM